MKYLDDRDIKVAIPLKTNSIRVPNKNLREFVDGKSLFDVKVEQLLGVFPPEDIYVSSEDLVVEKLCANYGLKFLKRDVSLTPNSAPWTDVVHDVVGQIPSGSDIMWVQVTQPLFKDFSGVLSKWAQVCAEYDSLAVVKKISHHIVDAKGHPVNFEFGYWHKVSQDLPSLFEITWACFCMNRQMVDRTGYQIGRRPFLYESLSPLVDIDSLVDFEVARTLFKFYDKAL